MKNQKSKPSGAYLQVLPRKRRFTQVIVFGVGAIALAVLMLFMLKGNETVERTTVYHLPDEIPVISLPENLEDNSGSMTVDDLVLPYFNFTLVADDNTIEVSLPLITAKYGADFNAAVQEQLGNLVSNTLYHLEKGVCIYKRVTYEVYLDKKILTVLLHTEYSDGQTLCQPWIYDLSNGGALISDTYELTERLLGMDYASFLCVTSSYIQDSFTQKYYDEAYSVPEAKMSMEQHEHLDAYMEIADEIPHDISNMFSRWLFPADGKVFLAFQLPIISNDWYVGFLSETVVVEIDENILKYKDMVVPEEAVLETILDSTFHVMGSSDQSHALLTRTVFYSSPDVFISAAASVAEADMEYMIESLLRYADEGECEKILGGCQILKAQEHLTNEENQIVESICSRIDEK